MLDERLRARAYARENGEDDPAIAGWQWQPESETAVDRG
jgi:xylulose-5-phosphate/fructose-6-phosphate phosphoketolase